jgi:hypothetical protein
VTPHLFLHCHRHRDRLQGIVGFVPGGGDDLVNDLHASKNFVEDGVGSVQPAVVRDADIELRAIFADVPRVCSRLLVSGRRK